VGSGIKTVKAAVQHLGETKSVLGNTTFPSLKVYAGVFQVFNPVCGVISTSVSKVSSSSDVFPVFPS
jgi:hypothetical protein